MIDIYLGSSSPRRKKILKEIINKFSIYHPRINESIITDESPESYCLRIAKAKSRFLLNKFKNKKNFLLICSDTIVCYQNNILIKPVDLSDAQKMLNKLSGNTHQVITALSLLYRDANGTDRSINKSEITSVTFKKLSEHEINSYLEIIDYKDKAGAYAIQENGDMIAESFKGSYSNVVGFPLRLFFNLIFNLNLTQIVFKI